MTATICTLAFAAAMISLEIWGRRYEAKLIRNTLNAMAFMAVVDDNQAVVYVHQCGEEFSMRSPWTFADLDEFKSEVCQHAWYCFSKQKKRVGEKR